MRLQKLTEKDIRSTAGKKICCYEKSLSHLTEFCEKYHVLDRIRLIVDDSARRQGDCLLFGKAFVVRETGALEQVKWSDCILVITSDYHREAYERLRSIESVNANLEVIYYFADRETEYEEGYRDHYKNSELEELIIFRSGPHASAYVRGMDFADNARALFEYMIAEGYNARCHLVWLVKDPSEFDKWRSLENVEFLSFDWSVSENREERDRYYRALCLAKYIFFTDAYGFARNCRPDQTRVQLWHGCGFKTRVNFVRCEKRYEYTTVISDLYGRIHQEIYGLREDQTLVTGYAKQDWLFHPVEAKYRKLLHIPEAGKYIYWLPTFRTAEKQLRELNEYELVSDTGFPVVHTMEQMGRLNELLEQERMALVIKLHPFQDKAAVQRISFSHIVMIDDMQLFQADIPVNRLLGEADALISDYSSAAVDYMLLDRPIAFLLEDVKEYEASRGFVFEPIRDWLPGAEIDSFEGLVGFIRDVAAGVDVTGEKRRRLKKQMHRFQDDQSCSRILSALGIRGGK